MLWLLCNVMALVEWSTAMDLQVTFPANILMSFRWIETVDILECNEFWITGFYSLICIDELCASYSNMWAFGLFFLSPGTNLSRILDIAFYMKNLRFKVLVCFSFQCSDKLGLSLELGSFVAGVMISTTDFAQHTLDQVCSWICIFLE